eukprot:gene2680-3454_t
MADVCASCTLPEEGDDGEPSCVCLNTGMITESEDLESPTVAEYVPPVDTMAPVLTLHGTGELGVTSSGVVVMVDSLQ